MASITPRQKISNNQKTPKWYRENTDSIIDHSNYYSDDRSIMIELYQAAAGEVNTDSYKYVLNPFNTADENLKQFPARLRNYDILIPILNLYLGEKAERPFNHTVIVANPDVSNNIKKDLDKAFVAAMAQDFVNTLNDSGVDTGVDSKEVDYKKILQKYQIDASDKRALFGQEALDYIKHQMSLKDKYLEAMYDWLVVGRVFTYKDVYKNDLLHDIVPPLEMWYGPTRSGFVEDASWAYRRSRYSLNDIIDRFHEAFTEKGDKKMLSFGGTTNEKDEDGNELHDPIDILEARFGDRNNAVSSVNGESSTRLRSEIDNGMTSDDSFFSNHGEGGLIEVHHVVWKGFTKVGILSYYDDLGIVQEMEVSEEYKINKKNGDISLKWEWMSIVHEQYRIDDNIYVYGRELQVQRQELSNSSKCKLPYNGRRGYSERDKVNSIARQVLPYSALVNIYHWRLEMIIAKNKEKLMLLPLGLLPDGEGWTEDKVFHIIESMGILPFDETKPNAVAVLNALKSIDMSLGKYISDMRNLIIGVKEEAWDAIGMNRQRYGDVNSSDGKGNTDQAIVRSSVISRELNRRFEKFEESDIQGLIEYSKAAWINGKKGSYINSQGRAKFLEVDGAEHLDTDYGVFAVNSQEEQTNLNKAKDYAFGIAQKAGTPYSTVLEVISANNMSKLKAIVNNAESIQRAYEQSVAENTQKGQENLAQMEAAKSDKEGQIKLEAENIKRDSAITVATIQAGSRNQEQVSDSDTDKVYDDYVDKVKANDLAKQKQGSDAVQKISSDRLSEAKLALDKKKADDAVKIAKMNKNKYD